MRYRGYAGWRRSDGASARILVYWPRRIGCHLRHQLAVRPVDGCRRMLVRGAGPDGAIGRPAPVGRLRAIVTTTGATSVFAVVAFFISAYLRTVKIIALCHSQGRFESRGQGTMRGSLRPLRDEIDHRVHPPRIRGAGAGRREPPARARSRPRPMVCNVK